MIRTLDYYEKPKMMASSSKDEEANKKQEEISHEYIEYQKERLNKKIDKYNEQIGVLLTHY